MRGRNRWQNLYIRDNIAALPAAHRGDTVTQFDVGKLHSDDLTGA